MTFPAPRRFSRRLIVLCGVALTVTAGVLWWVARSDKELPVAAFLVPLDEAAMVRIGWKRSLLDRPLPLALGRGVHLAKGAAAGVVHLDGRFERITGPLTYRLDGIANAPADVLVSPGPELISRAKTSLRRTPEGQSIAVTSPVGVTRFLNPVLSWNSRSDTLYDVAIVDPADPAAPPRAVRGVKPPIRLEQLVSPQRPVLEPDRIFAVLVRESAASEHMGANRFLTAATAEVASLPEKHDELLMEAIEALRAPPYRSGDAWLALARLPETWRETELVLRLRLLVAGELGLADELEDLSARLTAATPAD